MESSSQSQNQGQSPKSTRETLTPEAFKALGRVGPAQAWQQLEFRVLAAEDRDAEAQQILDEAEYKGDLDDLGVLMSKFKPVEGINLFNRENPTFDLQSIPQANPLLVLQAVLKAVQNDSQ